MLTPYPLSLTPGESKMNRHLTIAVTRNDAVLEVTLSRPNVRNAFNPAMISELKEVFAGIDADQTLRAVALTGKGSVFCSGGDLNWMKESLTYTPGQNIADAQNLYDLFAAMDTCRLPLVCAVEGFALGGGVGLVSVSDYVIADRAAQFSLSEVKVGLIPACIGPFVLRKIGPSQARALFLSSERFDADRARQIGLIHEVADDSKALRAALQRVLRSVCAASPQAVSVAKRFLRTLGEKSFAEQGPVAVKTLADIRVTDEAQEGLKAFLEKRPPSWAKK
jgi:methylglutaconyl-CoA hydratase